MNIYDNSDYWHWSSLIKADTGKEQVKSPIVSASTWSSGLCNCHNSDDFVLYTENFPTVGSYLKILLHIWQQNESMHNKFIWACWCYWYRSSP